MNGARVRLMNRRSKGASVVTRDGSSATHWVSCLVSSAFDFWGNQLHVYGVLMQ